MMSEIVQSPPTTEMTKTNEKRKNTLPLRKTQKGYLQVRKVQKQKK